MMANVFNFPRNGKSFRFIINLITTLDGVSPCYSAGAYSDELF